MVKDSSLLGRDAESLLAVIPTFTSSHQLATQETDIHAPGGIRTHDPSKRAAADPRLRPRGHWDRPLASLREYNLQLTFQS